jgi:hypothetical protein
LTINNSTSNSTTATACDSYTWSVNGLTYTASGTYTATSTNAAGCTHTETLNLTINNSTSNSTTATACDSYTWSANGLTYTASGTYTATSTNAAGCTHTETLNLTINNSTSNNTTATACDSYTWSANGLSYTASGTYTATSTNAAGCTHTATLNLTINNSTSNSTSATACDSYTWSANGLTYTASGTYTATSTNAAGCTHTEILVLTINSSPLATATPSPILCNGDNSSVVVTATGGASPYTGTGSFTVSAGNYSYTVTDANGCTSTASGTITQPTVLSISTSSNTPCVGDALNMTSTPAGGQIPYFSYTWTGAASYNSQNPTVANATAGLAGAYTVTVADNNGCTASASLTVSINALPTPTISASGSTVLCAGGSVDLTSSSATGNVWSNTSSNQTITVSADGNYTVTVTDGNGCVGTSAITQITTLGTAVIAPTDGTTYTATHECTDGAGWTYYYDNSTVGGPYLMLGIQKGSNAATFGTVPTVVVQVGGAAAGAVDLSAAPYVTNGTGYSVMSRFWTLEPVQEPSTDVPVRTYYQDFDFNAVKVMSGNAGMTHDSLFFYKINDLNNVWNENPSSGHTGILSALTYDGNGIWPYLPGGPASTTAWAYTSLGSGNHQCEFVVGHFGGGGGGATGNNITPFPVELAYFNGHNQGTSNLLNWVTVSELANKSFEVQRSIDGVSYQTIGSVNSKAPNGTSTANLSYEFVDHKPATVSYYRLKQIDIDGGSNILPQVVEIALTDNFKTAIDLFPNPTSSELNVAITGAGTDNYLVEVSDIYGRAISSVQQLSNGGTTISTIDVRNLAQGTYIVTVKDRTNSIVSTQRFVKE